MTDKDRCDQDLAKADRAERLPRAREQPERPGVEGGVPVAVAAVEDLPPLDDRIVLDDPWEEG